MKNSSTLRCAIAKTIGLIVGVFLVASFHVWLGKTFGPDIFGEIAKMIAMLVTVNLCEYKIQLLQIMKKSIKILYI